MGVARWRRGDGRVRLRWAIGAGISILLVTAGAHQLYTHQKHRNTLRLLQDAEAHRTRGDWAKAAAAYRQYLRRNPADRSALAAYGDVLHAQVGTSPEAVGVALGVFRQLIAAEPENVDAIGKLASICLAVGRLPEAERLSARWLESSPDSPDAALALTRALHGQGKHDEAAEVLKQALLRAPGEGRFYPPLIRLLAVELDKPEDALVWAQKGLRAAATHPDVLMAVFALYQQRGEPDTAEQHLLQALKLAPDVAEVLISAGAFFTSRGRLEQADELLDRARELAPADRRVLMARAEWAVRKDTPAALTTAAAELLSQAADSDVHLLAQAADLLLRAREWGAADECMAKLDAAEDADGVLDGWLDALKGMRASLNGRPYTAVAHLDNADRRQPSNSQIKTLLARVFAEIGALDSAAVLYRHAIALSRDSTDARLALAGVELRRRRPAAAREAIGAISDATAVQAFHAEVIGVTSDLMQAQQQERSTSELKELQTTLARLSDDAPPDAATASLLASCLLLGGQRERAVDLLRAAMRSSDDGAELGSELGRLLLGQHSQGMPLQGEALDQADALADELVDRFPHAADGHELRIRVLAKARRLRDAQAYVDDLVISDGIKGGLSETLAELYLENDQKEPAIRALRQAVSLLPGDLAVRQKLARLTPQLEEALALVDEIRSIEDDAGLYWKYERAGVLIRIEPSESGIERATELLQTCLVQRPYWVSAQLLLGDAHYLAGRLERAVDSYRAAIAQRAELAAGVVGLKLVRTLKKLDRFSEADIVLDALADAHPNAPEVLRLRTEQQYRNRDIQSAATTAERLMQMEPDDPAWGALTADLHRRAGNLPRAEKIARVVLQKNPAVTSALWSLAQALVAQDRSDEAKAIVQDSVERHDDHPHWLLFARVLAQLGSAERAEAILARITKNAPDDARVWAGAADIARLLGNRADQLAFVRRAMMLQGSDPSGSIALAELLIEGGTDQERSEAAGIVAQRLAASPDDPQGLILDGQLAALRNPPDLARAETSWTRSLAIDPRSAIAHRLLGALQLRLGRPEAAHDTISAGLAIAPHDPHLLLTSARIDVAMGGYSRAVLPLKHLLELRPRTPEALRLLATAYMNGGQVNQAVRFLEAHAPQDTRTPAEVAIVARLQEAQENFDQAEALFRRAAAMDVASPELHRDLIDFLARRNKFDDIHALASERRVLYPDDVESLASAAQILGSRSEDPHLREIGLGWLDAIARDEPEHAPDAIYRSALCYYAIGEMGRAESKFLEFLRLAPGDPRVVNDLAWVYSEHLGRPDKAVALIERFVSAGGVPDAHMLDTHGVALLRLNRLDDAKPKLASCLRIAGRTPTRTAAGYHLGQLFLKTGQRDEGISYLREALYLDELRGGLSPAEREEALRLTAAETPPAPSPSASPVD